MKTNKKFQCFYLHFYIFLQEFQKSKNEVVVMIIPHRGDSTYVDVFIV